MYAASISTKGKEVIQQARLRRTATMLRCFDHVMVIGVGL